MKQFVKPLFTSALIFSTLFAFTLTSKVHAAAIIEPIQEYRAAPGSVRTGYINIAFTPSDPAVLYLNVEKLETEDGTNKQTSRKAATSENTVANWMTLESNVVYKPENPRYINNDNVRKIGYRIDVPANAEPGSDYAVVIISERNAAIVDNAVAVSKDVTTSILMTVEGDTVEEADLTSFSTVNNQFIFSSLPVDFAAKFTNNGNVHVIPRGNIEIFSGSNKIDNVSLNPTQSRTLPDKTYTYFRKWSNENIEEQREEQKIKELEAQLPKNFIEEVIYQIRNFRVGIYSAELQGFAGKRQIKGSVTFIVFPIHLALTIIGIGAVIYAYQRNKNRKPAKKSRK